MSESENDNSSLSDLDKNRQPSELTHGGTIPEDHAGLCKPAVSVVTTTAQNTEFVPESGNIESEKISERFDCPFCDRSFINFKKNLYRHIRNVHNVDTTERKQRTETGVLVCSICKEPVSRFLSNLNRHIRKVHKQVPQTSNGDIRKPCVCSFCGKSFKDFKCRQKHVKLMHKTCDRLSKEKIQTSTRQYKCTLCDAPFLRLSSTYRHLRKCHKLVNPGRNLIAIVEEVMNTDEEDEPDNNHECYLCNEEFETEEEWCTHMKDIHEVNPNNCCSKCGEYQFRTMSDLLSHMESEHDIRPAHRGGQSVEKLPGTGLLGSEIRAIQNLPEWLLKRSPNGILVIVHREKKMST